MTDLDLYQEEQRQILLDTKKEIADLTTFVEHLVDIYVAPKDEVAVKGELIVNTEKEVSVTNLDSLLNGLNELSSKVTKAIADNKPEAIKNVAISNIKDAKADKVAVTNLKELQKDLGEIVKAVNGIEIVEKEINTQAIETKLDNIYDRLDKILKKPVGGISAGGGGGIQTNTLVPFKYSAVYLSNYDANSNPQTVVYKQGSTTVATLTISYSGTNITSVVRS